MKVVPADKEVKKRKMMTRAMAMVVRG